MQGETVAHRFDVEVSMGRGWRAECDCGWLSPTYLTVESTYAAGDRHLTSPAPWRECPGCKRQWPELVVQTHERDPALCAAYRRDRLT